MKKLSFILLLLFMCVSCSNIKTNSISDHLLGIYEFVIPFDNVEGSYAGDLTFRIDDMSLDEFGQILKGKGYLIENSEDYHEKDILLVNYIRNNKKLSIFSIQKNRFDQSNEENVFFVTPLTQGNNNIAFSYPEHFIYHETVALENNDYDNIYHINKSFEELVEFYQNNSLSEIHELDLENKTIIVQAVDKNKGRNFNRLAKIKYIEDENYNHIKFEIIDYDK